MNLFVADPEWGWWIILYFFLGGIAAGAYFVAALMELIGGESDRALARVGYRIAFPLVLICGLLLTIDLERPERFWHMLLQSEVVDEALTMGWPKTGTGWSLMLQSPNLKLWSPMSVGAWALFFFGMISFLSFLASVWPEGWLARFLYRRWFGHAFQFLGSGFGFFIASYTGALLTASNQPLWSQTEWVGPLFLSSAGSAGIAVLLLVRSGAGPTESGERLERADLWALGLEAGVFVIFLASLGGSLFAVWNVWQGKVLILAVPLLGLLLPLGLQLWQDNPARWRLLTAAGSALLGGFLLRYAIVTIPPALLHFGTSLTREQLRQPLIQTVPGWVFLGGMVVFAILIPPFLDRRMLLNFRDRLAVWIISAAVCLTALAYTFRGTSTEAGTPAAWLRISPEDGRQRDGGPGASGLNRPWSGHPRSRVFGVGKVSGEGSQ
jgi:formate-dependent nitrite reductase membrane component NrfD